MGLTATERRWWRAALRRDPACDGAFVFGVATTAVYCRASCPARRPRLANVAFFRTSGEAEREGFRACLRCGPSRRAGVLGACELIARSVETPPTLERLARHAGLSPGHLQRVFLRSLGVTPKQYARRLRFERFGRRLRSGSPIAPALYAAGFGSSSRLYERAISQLGMTPAAVARKGLGMRIAYDLMGSPLGRVLIAATPLGICAVELGSSDRGLAKGLRDRFPAASIGKSSALLRFAKERLRRLFAGALQDPSLPLDLRATAFQARVWESLRSIPYGETRTYAEVARSLGRPRAVRAVARACGSNPVALLIPCHRVLGSGGELRGYRWGLARKRALLRREGRKTR